MSNAVSFRRQSIWFATAAGERLGVVDDFLSLRYTLSQNVPGALTLVLPADSGAITTGVLRLDTRLYVLRDDKLEGDTCWLVRGMRYFTDADGARFWELRATSALELLNRRIVPFANGNVDSYASKTDAADDMMKSVVLQNLGGGAPAERRVAGLSIQEDVSLGPTLTQNFEYERVLQVCQDIADATKDTSAPEEWVYFDIVVTSWQNGTLQFRTYVGSRGSNHGYRSERPVIFSDSAGTLVEAEVEWDHFDEITHVYAVRQGDPLNTFSAEDSDATRLHASSLNRREGFVETAEGFNTVTGAEIAPALAEGRPRIRVRASIPDLPGLRYGVHWGVGDIVGVSFGPITGDFRVDSVSVSVESGRETVDTHLESDSPL